MEAALTPAAGPSPSRPLDPAVVAGAMRAATAAVAAAGTPAAALDAAIAALEERLQPCFVAALVCEHDRLWLVGSHGYAAIPDGLRLDTGVVGRAVRSRRTQYVPDLAADPDYVEVAKGVASELAVPLELDGDVVGVLNVETVAPLPRAAAKLARPLAAALAPVLAELRSRRVLDLSALSRLCVRLSSLRDAREIAEIGAAALTRILPVETTQVLLRAETGELVALAGGRAARDAPELLAPELVRLLRDELEQSVVVGALDLERRAAGAARTVVVLPLRANGEELGLLVGTSRRPAALGREQREVAAVLAAQMAASLDAALALDRERRSALTDPLTALLNRRGFEATLEQGLALAHAERLPLSVAVLDFDDFKEVNDRAGHEFGDALLREVGHVLRRVVPDGAGAARLGGDEFVVMLPGVDAESARTVVERVRGLPVGGLDEAGFPLRVSAGVSTYPFDGGVGTELVRAADQALYEAKAQGKNCVVAFRDLVRAAGAHGAPPAMRDRRGGALDSGALVEAIEAAAAIWREHGVARVLERLSKSLTFVVGATGCNVSRVVGARLVDVVAHALRDVPLSADSSYLIDEFPLTKAVLESLQARSISFLDDDLDRSEAFVLRELEMSCALLLPLAIHGRAWGLVELYDMRLRRYTPEQQALAEFLVTAAGARLEALGDDATAPHRLPLYRVPDAPQGRRRELT